MRQDAKATAAVPAAAPSGLTMLDAIARAKAAVATLTVLPFDAVGRCERRPEGGWAVALDVIESLARMGDNDLLATFEIDLDSDGHPVRILRTRRYHREDGDLA